MRATSGASGAVTDRQIPARSSAARALFEAMRVRQWPRNGLVVAAPLAAGVLFGPDVLLDPRTCSPATTGRRATRWRPGPRRPSVSRPLLGWS
jgi:hypothetical protein